MCADDKKLPGDVRLMASSLLQSAEWDDEGPRVAALMGDMEGAVSTDNIDNEYRHAGVEDPRIFLTTSHNPSSRLKMFAKVSE